MTVNFGTTWNAAVGVVRGRIEAAGQVVAMFRDALRGPCSTRVVEGVRLDLVDELGDVQRYRVTSILDRPGCARRLFLSRVAEPPGPAGLLALAARRTSPARLLGSPPRPSGVGVPRFDPKTGHTTYGLFQFMPIPPAPPVPDASAFLNAETIAEAGRRLTERGRRRAQAHLHGFPVTPDPSVARDELRFRHPWVSGFGGPVDIMPTWEEIRRGPGGGGNISVTMVDRDPCRVQAWVDDRMAGEVARQQHRQSARTRAAADRNAVITTDITPIDPSPLRADLLNDLGEVRNTMLGRDSIHWNLPT